MSGARVKCHRCGQWLAVIDWSDPAAAQVADRIVAGHAVECIPPRAKVAAVCSIDGCGKKARARGWCTGHWKRWSRYGDPLAFAPQDRPLPTVTIPPVPPDPEPTFQIRSDRNPAICQRCGQPYAADAGLPEGLLRSALAVHRCKQVSAA